MTDDDDYTLFNPDDHPEPPTVAHARAGDPWTSHAAAESIPSDKIRKSQQAVLKVLRQIPPASDIRIQDAYEQTPGLPAQSPSGLRTRRSELVAAGLVIDSGLTEVLPSGRRAIRWTVAP